MASEADVANLALGRLRVSSFITALSDQNNEARLCSRFFNQCRQEVLRAFPWNFASKPQALAEVVGQEYPGWTYVYQYPDDCLRIHAVSDVSGIRDVGSAVYSSRWRDFDVMCKRWPFRIGLKDDNASRVVMSDMPSAYAFFTADVETIGVWPPDAVSALAWRLAVEIGGPLQADSSVRQDAANGYALSLAGAAASSMNEAQSDPVPDSPSISCRY